MQMGFERAFDPFFAQRCEVRGGQGADGAIIDTIPCCVMPGDMVGDDAGSRRDRVSAESWCVMIRRRDWRSATPPRMGNVIALADGKRLTVQSVDLLGEKWRCACTAQQRAGRV